MAVEIARDREVPPKPASSGGGLARLHGRIPWWVSLGVLALLLGFARDFLAGVGTADEAWFLYVLHRLNLGQVLYRDVWVPVFPLAVWVAQVFTQFLGEHIFVLKAADTFTFMVTVIATVSVTRRIAPESQYAPLVLGVLLGWAGPGVVGPGSLYTALAYALTAGALAMVLMWIDSGADVRSRSWLMLLAAAAMAGLAFTSKQTIGILAVGALLGTIVLVGGRREIRASMGRAAASAGVAIGMIVLTMIPVALTGGLPALLRDTLSSTGSAAYLSVASIPYLAGLVQFAGQLLNPISLSWLGAVTLLGVFVAPLVVVPLFIWAFTRNAGLRMRAIGIFTLAALGGSYPRADYPHFVAVLPFLLIAGIVGWQALKPHLTDSVIAVALVLVVVVTGVRLTAVVLAPWGTGNSAAVVSDLPHFEGALFTVEDDRAARDAVRSLSAASQKNVFVLSLRAGLLYLSTGREDPTAYDFPDLYGFGGFEQDDVINAVEDGRIEAIWFDSHVLEYLGWEDSRIMAYVRHAMRPFGFETPWGQLYVPSGR